MLFNKTNPVTNAAGFVFAIKKDVKLKGGSCWKNQENIAINTSKMVSSKLILQR